MRYPGIIIAILYLLVGFQTNAQVDFRFSQFLQNPVPANPAFTGIEDYLDVKLGYRQQWIGFEGAPSNNLLTLNHALNVTRLPENVLKGTRIESRQNYRDMEAASTFAKRKAGRHGIALTLNNGNNGGFRNLAIGANYAYHLRVARRFVWSVGATAGFRSSRFDAANISVLNPSNDAIYNYYLQNEGIQNNLELNLGTIFYHQHFYIGYSFLGAELVQLSKSEAILARNRMFHSAQGGVNLNFGNGMVFSPSMLVYFRPQQPDRYLVNARIKWQDTIWGGLQYDHRSNASISVGGLISGVFSVNYSYAYPLSDVNLSSAGSHEVILGIKLFNKNWSESYLW